MSDRPLRIVLSNLPFQYFPGAGNGMRNYYRPQLSIAYLAAYLRERLDAPAEIKLVDCAAEDISTARELERRLLALRPDVIGFSVVTATRNVAGGLAVRLKKRLPDVRIVLGGPHISAMPEETSPGVDALFFSEGEASLTEYIQRVVLGGDDGPVAGCNILADGEVAFRGGPRPLIQPLDEVPIPAWDLMKSPGTIHSYPHKYSALASMLTSRGCPFNCSFCGNRTLWGGKVRYFSADRVAQEIDYLVEHVGADLIFIEDDTFLFNKELSAATMEHIRRKHPRLGWICHTRADVLNEENVREMKRSGCVEVQVGVESGSQEILDSVCKKITLDDVRRSFKLLNSSGIKGWATFIIGNNGETKRTIEESVKLAVEIDPAYASFILLLPFPGTKAYEEYKSMGYMKSDDWSDFSWHGEPVFATPELSRGDLTCLRRRAWLRFYLRPEKLFSIFMDTLKAGSAKEAARSFRFFLSLVAGPGRTK